MSSRLLVYPMFALVVLTASVVFLLFRARVRAVKAGDASASYFRIYQGGAEPAASAQLARQFTNLFEAPVLFYVACVTAMAVDRVNSTLLALAWAYVAARALHAWVHVGRNRLRHRIAAYMLSWLVLLALWLVLVVTISSAP